MTKRFVPDSRFEGRPRMPFDRPPTRAEVWEYVTHWYGDIKNADELRDFARTTWAGNYAYWVNSKGWRKHPDWREGEKVVASATPTGPILPEQVQRLTYELYERVKKARSSGGQLQLEGEAA